MRTPRKDQLRNRQRLVTAARDAFGEHGLDISLEEIARRAGVGPTTLYRHFTGKDDLIEAVLDDLVASVRDNARRAASGEDPREAFGTVFTRSCDLSERDMTTFARLAAANPNADQHAQTLIAAVIGPATTRLRDAGGLRADITTEDIATFVRMTVSAGNPHTREKAIQVLLAGLIIDPS